MNFGEAIASVFRNYVTFSGRAARAEYWYWVLFTLILSIVTVVLDRAIFPDSESGAGPINTVASIIILLPSIAVGVRRLHDIDRTGWWYLIVFTIIGVFLLIYWACQRGTPGANRFGPDPLQGR
jgi:uncharacterized membrane protein YhaH (DUF805 family)